MGLPMLARVGRRHKQAAVLLLLDLLPERSQRAEIQLCLPGARQDASPPERDEGGRSTPLW